jgi:hypothetical protein
MVSDFNSDGQKDLVYLDMGKSIVSVLYQDEYLKFYPEITYLEETGIVDICLFKDKISFGIAVFKKDGYISTISKFQLKDSIKTIFSSSPGKIQQFDYKNDAILDLCYIDKKSQTLRIIIRDKKEIPSLYYSIPISSVFSEIVVDEISKTEKVFYLFNLNSRLIEVISVNFGNSEIKKEKLYAEGLITDLKINKRKSLNKRGIITAQILDGKLSRIQYTVSGFKYSITSSSNLDNDVLEAKLDGDGNLFYWKIEQNFFKLISISMSSPIQKQELYKHKITAEDELRLLTDDFLNTGKGVSLSFIKSKKRILGILASPNNKSFINSIDNSKFFLPARYNTFMGEYKTKSQRKMFLYLPKEKSINSLEISSNGRNLNLIKIAEDIQANSFLINKMFTQDYFLVYSDSSENCITFKKLN